MKDDVMKDALMKRRGQGLDINILVKPAADEGKTDLAPPGPGEKPGMMAESPEDEQKEMDMGEVDQEMMDPMQQHEIDDLQSRKPRSIGDRAKLAAMSRMSKK